MIDEKSIQRALRDMSLYNGPIDGAIGRGSYAAMRTALKTIAPSQMSWPAGRLMVAFQQLMMKEVGIDVGEIDGLVGPQTQHALELWQNRLRDLADAEADAIGAPQLWPRQSQVRAVFGEPGSSLVKAKLPYPLRIAWAPNEVVTSMLLHSRVADSAVRVLTRVKDRYGAQKIQDLHLDVFSGSYNQRNMKGGTRLSMHAWAIAIDWDSERNQFRWGRDRASLARPDYDAWWAEWEREGWLSLGRARNFDWMHVQAARL